MTKPVIVKRLVKGSALTYAEHDLNFQNLADATITLTAGTGGTAVVSDLNGVITLVAGAGITLTGNNTAKTITINSNRYFSVGSVSGVSFTPNFNNGNVQKVSISDAITVNAPTNMAAGDTFKLIVVLQSLSPASMTVAFSGIVIATNSNNEYFENSDPIVFPNGDGNFILDVVYDGSVYWGTVNTNFV
jgi:hypothetical protein